MAAILHDLTVQEAQNLLMGSTGFLLIDDTDIHYGDYWAIYGLEDAVFTEALTYEIGANGVAYTSGTTALPAAGDSFTTASGAKGTITEVTVSSGTWAGGNAAGWIKFAISGTALPTAEEAMTIKRNNAAYASCTLATAANGGECASAALATRALNNGDTIRGKFYKIQLASGACLAYKR